MDKTGFVFCIYSLVAYNVKNLVYASQKHASQDKLRKIVVVTSAISAFFKIRHKFLTITFLDKLWASSIFQIIYVRFFNAVYRIVF